MTIVTQKIVTVGRSGSQFVPKKKERTEIENRNLMAVEDRMEMNLPFDTRMKEFDLKECRPSGLGRGKRRSSMNSSALKGKAADSLLMMEDS